MTGTYENSSLVQIESARTHTHLKLPNTVRNAHTTVSLVNEMDHESLFTQCILHYITGKERASSPPFAPCPLPPTSPPRHLSGCNRLSLQCGKGRPPAQRKADPPA